MSKRVIGQFWYKQDEMIVFFINKDSRWGKYYVKHKKSHYFIDPGFTCEAWLIQAGFSK